MCEFSFVNLWFKEHKDYVIEKIFYCDEKSIIQKTQTLDNLPEFIISRQQTHNLFWYQFFKEKNNAYSHVFKNKCMTMKETYRI